MGGKGNWFSSVKKALSPEPREKTDQKSNKSKKRWFGKHKLPALDSSFEAASAPPPQPPAPSPPEEPEVIHVQNESSSAQNVAVVAPAYVEKVVSSALAVPIAVETKLPKYVGKTDEEVAAIKIQTAFRGYLARRAFRALRGLVRLKSLMEGPVVRRQAISTLKSMQTLARVQSQIHSRRIRMLEENQALQKQLLQKHAKEIESVRIEEEWDDSFQSKEQIEAKLFNKYEAAMRRERSLAYAFSHQQSGKNPSRSVNPMFMDPTNPSWGWSWLERWMAARPWEGRKIDRELNHDNSSVKSASYSSAGGEISKSYARYQLNSDKFSPSSSQNQTPPDVHPHSAPPKAVTGLVARKLKSASPMDSLVSEDDCKSVISMKSERYRRHSIGGTSVRDDESLVGSPSIPSYMVPTKSAKAKSRMQSPLATENGTSENSSVGTAKKRLSFPPAQARPRRHSVPSKLESSLNSEISVGNGVGH